MYELRFFTDPDWAATVVQQMDAFLLDHASAEKKASGVAVSLISHYPDKTRLVEVMADIAVEEMMHFREVLKIILERGLTPGADQKDAYINAMMKHLRQGSEEYFLDRLVLGSIIEARGHERFSLVAKALKAGKLQRFYQAIAESELRHKEAFLELALFYLPEDAVLQRLDELLDAEAAIARVQDVKAALH